MTQDDDALQAAIIKQLNAEMGAQGMPIAELARRLGREYDSTRNYMKQVRAMSLGVFLEIAAVLNVDPDVILARARHRMK